MKRSLWEPVLRCIGVIIASLFILASCGRSSQEGASLGGKESRSDKMAAVPSADIKSIGGAETELPNEPPPMEGADSLEPASRKRIKRGDIWITVEDITKAEEKLRSLTEEYGGYISTTNVYEESATITVKVPAESFDSFMTSSEGLGKVRSKSVTVEDVTDRYFDLETRIRNKEILVERYQSYLEEAESVEDLLAIERSLNETITELERLRGSFRKLRNLISYSTLSVELSLPEYEREGSPLPSIREGLKRLGQAILTFLYYLGFGIVYAVIFGIPIVLLAALIYFISFGRLGLVRKLFRLLSTKKK